MYICTCSMSNTTLVFCVTVSALICYGYDWQLPGRHTSMSYHGSWVMTTGHLVAMLAAGVGVSSPGGGDTFGGYGALVSILGLLAGVNLVSLGVWMTDGPADTSATAPSSKALLTTCVRRNPAVVGIALSSWAVAALVAGAASPALGLGLLALLLIGISLTVLGVLGTCTRIAQNPP